MDRTYPLLELHLQRRGRTEIKLHGVPYAGSIVASESVLGHTEALLHQSLDHR
jgi:hypothetical protein